MAKNKKRKKKSVRIVRSNLEENKKKIKKPRKFKFFFLKFLFYVFLLAFFFSIPYFIFGKDFLEIKTVDISGEQKIPKAIIENELNNMRQGKWLGILTKNNIIFPWEGMLEKRIEEKYPILRDLKVEKKLPHDLNVIVEERNPVLILATKNNNCVFDERGYKFDLIEDFNYLGDESMMVIKKNQGDPFTECSENFDLDYLNFMIKFKKELEEQMDISLDRFWETPNLASGDLRINSTSNWKILLDKNLGSEKEVEMLRLLFKNKLNEEEKKELEYIDLRTQNRIYYKLKKKEQLEEKSDE